MNQGWTYREQVKPIEAEQTVLEYYTQKYPHSNQEEWQTRIESGRILVNNQLVNTTTLLKAQDRLIYHRSPWVEADVPLKFEILYEDRDLLIINKPSGLPVMPGGNFLEHTLLGQLKKLYPQHTPVPVHRLGRGTSGLMLLGRSSLAKSHLAQQMRDSTIEPNNKQIKKVYRTLVKGNSFPEHLTIDQSIGKIPHPVLGYIYGVTSSGKFALSQCRLIKRHQNSSLLEVTIATGRPHQIRIHLAAVGYPLLGDPLYVVGGTFAPVQSNSQAMPVPGDCGYFLHAYSLSFIHPRKLQKMTFDCPIYWN